MFKSKYRWLLLFLGLTSIAAAQDTLIRYWHDLSTRYYGRFRLIIRFD